MGLRDSEYELITSTLGREPNETELGLYSAMWSEHCGYKHSKAYLRLLPSQAPHVLQGPGENAGIVDIGRGVAVVLKMESHNHPSAVEPFQGAATGVGGILRDIFTMGARPICFLDSLRFGPPEDEVVKYLMAGVVSGISAYGNCVGIPTVAGEVAFHGPFKGNPLVNVMCVGIIRDPSTIARGITGEPGNVVMVVGSKTGRDGIRGAAFASEGLGSDSEKDRPSVQVGDPFTGKLLIEACLEVIEKRLVVGIQDMGAAGLISSASEMAGKSKTGMVINLDLVPRREAGMTPYEVMLSESQERMLIVARPEKVEEIREHFGRWGLDATPVGEVTDSGMLQLFDKGELVAEVPVGSLVNPPVYDPPAERPDYIPDLQELDPARVPEPQDLGKALLSILARPNIASKRWVYEQYDYSVGTDTVIGPGRSDACVMRVKHVLPGGSYFEDPDAGAAQSTLIREGPGHPELGIAVTTDCNARYCYLDPGRGAMQAVAEAARNLSMTGARPLAITDCLNFGNPEKPHVYWQFQECVKGIAHAARALSIPVVSGNVSFYNECGDGRAAVWPTPVIGMVGGLEDVSRACASAFSREGDVIILVGPESPGDLPGAGSGAELGGEIGGSEYLEMVTGEARGKPPVVDLELEGRMQALVRSLITQGKVRSAHDLSDGGLGVALAECCIPGDFGAEVVVEGHGRPDFILFGETQSRALVSAGEEELPSIYDEARRMGVPVRAIGRVKGRGSPLAVEVKTGEGLTRFEVPVSRLRDAWEGAIPSIFDDMDRGDSGGGDDGAGV
ncbi:MAG TPA: phosphoribosylformylglycinamidine synthase subunit PurL [Firmicutes bacterium]|nr:phosphoribosylformylglycinamidine synthase subunit PurL [Bacillota bacterium]